MCALFWRIVRMISPSLCYIHCEQVKAISTAREHNGLLNQLFLESGELHFNSPLAFVLTLTSAIQQA